MEPFYQVKPTESRMFPCPACHEIIDIASRTCRYCNSPIDAARARQLNEQLKQVTDAVASANAFKFSIWIAILIMIVSPLYTVGVIGINVQHVVIEMVGTIGAIFYGVNWLRKYSKLQTGDPDYPRALRSVKCTFIVWVVAFVVQVVVLRYLFSMGVWRI